MRSSGPGDQIHEILRHATQGPHERLHHHAGFSAVQHATITLPHYQALLTRLYGFYLPFETATGGAPLRTQWLAQDLAWFGIEPAAIRPCQHIPPYPSPAHRLGALYVVEGSALGGRTLCRGLDQLLGEAATEGRRFFTGHGPATGDTWRGFLNQLAAAGQTPPARTALISAAVETFAVFETWLHGWNQAK
jgi:heme oxygenase